jgi:type II secretory pathway component GspD/PulD (secretin)
MDKITVKITPILIFLVFALLLPSGASAKTKIERDVTFNFVDVDLPVIAKFVSEITSKNFILDERIKGKITIIAPIKLSVADTFNLFTAVLEMKGFTVIPSGVNAYSIIPTSEAKQKGLKFDKDTTTVNASYRAQLIPLKHISSGEVLKLVQPIISKDGYTSSFGPGNLLLVVDSGINIANILSIIDTIDKPSETRGLINICFLENADAVELSKVLETLIRSAQSQTQKQQSVASAFESVSGISVTSDKASNALIIIASPADYQNLLQIIKKLDKRRRQVFVEAMIAEISIDKLLELGTKWRAAVRSGGQPVFVAGVGNVDTSTISSIATGLAGLTLGGLSNYYTLPASFISGATSDVSVPGLAALLSLNDFRDAVNVLSSPQILTSDNKEAEIIVGENVPFPSKRERDITTTNTVLASIERKDVGITLKITPQINEGDYVKLDIYQEISALVGQQSENILTSIGPTFTKRSTKTAVVVKDKQTVVIGGLMQEKDEEIVQKAPFFGDIPLIGWLFKYKSVHKTKTNLLVFLTPHIVTEADRLGQISRDKLTDFTKKEKLYIEGEMIVTFKGGVTEETAKAVIARQNAVIIKTIKEKTYHIKLKKEMDAEEAANKFSAIPEVEKTEPVQRLKIPSESELLRPPVSSSDKKEISANPHIESTVLLPVEEKKLKDRTEDLPATVPPKITNSGKYAIQIKAYPEAEKNDAMAFADDLRKRQPDTHVEKVTISGRGVWYRILIGHFVNNEDASNYMKEKKILDAHPGSFVQLKSAGQSSDLTNP